MCVLVCGLLVLLGAHIVTTIILGVSDDHAGAHSRLVLIVVYITAVVSLMMARQTRLLMLTTSVMIVKRVAAHWNTSQTIVWMMWL